jgi:magnesium-transporting ATPase (P-type)
MTGSTVPDAEQLITIPWHARTLEQVEQELATTQEGLAGGEAQQRLEQFGPNRLKPAQRRGPLVRFLLQFHNILIYVLIAAGIATALLDHWIDTGVIFAVVVINALIGFIQEGKAEKALEAISRMLSLEATVIRDGKRQTVPAEQLVPGDRVLLRAGAKVPADLRLVAVRELQIDEAMLTGESVPVTKETEVLPEVTDLGDRLCLAFSGTLVTSGQGVGLVVATGDHTELGKISQMVSDTKSITTPLIRQMNQFGHILAILIVAFAVLTFTMGYLVGGGEPVELFLAAVALAVAAIPEGLPAVMTIVLAIGVRRMANRNAIIRRLPAVDTLGALTVICSDKTGTLTRNEMTVTSIVTGGAVFEVSGVGYAPHGSIQAARHDLASEASSSSSNRDPEGKILHQLVRAGLLCNDADLTQEEGEWQPHGDPMEGALITLAMKSELDVDACRREWKTRDTIPFESRHRFMATLHDVPPSEQQAGSSGRIAFIKGAPEQILSMCDRQESEGEAKAIERSYWEEQAEHMASDGKRVLALGYLPGTDDQNQLDFDAVQSGLVMLGLVGIIDPPRDEAIRAVKKCHEAGISVVMITGDHALTARAIGRQLGIGDGQLVMTGQELDELEEGGLRKAVRECEVFARVSPEHKLRLVQAIQAEGAVVAMTGDGVNDAPALKRADVGIAMGVKGTEVTKEAAEMVLTDDNFASIAHAVEEGRTVYDNLRKTILFILPTNGGEGLTILIAIMFGMALPLTPVQVLWVNMITAVTLSLALAFEPPEAKVMKRPPRDPNTSLINSYFLWRIILVSFVICAGTFGTFLWMQRTGQSDEMARTVAVNTIVFFEVFYLFNTRFITAPSLHWRGLFGSRPVLIAVALVIVFQLLFTYLPMFQFLFHTEPLQLTEWLVLIAIAANVLWVVELDKWFARRWMGESINA